MRKVTFFNLAPFSHAKGAITKAGITVIGAALTLLGLVFLLLPGPGLLLIILGLALLSTQYAWAKLALRRSQRKLTQSAAWLDGMTRRLLR
ncbi:PGPGW domain-containing protein [Shewanella baltica]|uniref:PGPGW domain-containing protein n=1 Tax=Shewanella baltica TaxID=62322 RepID=UPI003D7B2C5F